MMMAHKPKTTYRYKTIVVPYARMSGNNHIKIFLFKDRESGDMTFVTGGCKQNEDAYICASRELQEESKNTLTLSSMQNMSVFSFETKYRPPAHAKDDARRNLNNVITKYVVYIIKTPFTSEADLDDYRKSYINSVVGNAKAYNETTDVVFATPNDILTKKYRIWDFLQKEVVPQVMPYFKAGRIP